MSVPVSNTTPSAPAPLPPPRAPKGLDAVRAKGQMALSLTVGWFADRWVPPILRSPLYRTYAALTGADLTEMRGAPRDYRSVGAFFVRELREGARPIDPDPRVLPSPVDGMVQASAPIEAEQVIEAKGRSYPLRELLAGVGEGVALEGGHAFTLYLGPKDYHRIHAPLDVKLVAARHAPGRRWSVQPRVLATRTVLPVNERVVLQLEAGGRTFFMVLVGALIVGRIRVVGLDRFPAGPVTPPLSFERGAELGRFEMGSTVVLVTPPGFLDATSAVGEGAAVRLGAPLAQLDQRDGR